MQIFPYQQFINRILENNSGGGELGTILPWLPRPAKDGPWIAGGAIRRTITDGKLNEGDVDYFFRDKQQFDDFCKQIREDKQIKIEKETINENNIQFKLKIPLRNEVLEVQAINFEFYPNVEKLISGFDFTVCQFAYDGYFIYCGDYALWDLGRKRIVINNVRFPVATIRHLVKYSKQGFFACAGALTELTRRIVALGPSAINDKMKYID